MNKRGLVFALILLLVSVTFFACDFGEIPTISISGSVTVSEVGLEGVEIKSSIKSLTKTNPNGEFTFSEKAKSITIIPELQGYFFEPSSITVTQDADDISFVAIKIYELDGKIVLSKLSITPTSIALPIGSYGNNYLYQNNGQDALKLNEISVLYRGVEFELGSLPTYLYKGVKNEVDFGGNVEIDCGTKATVGICINTYFKMNNEEYRTSNSDYKYIDIRNVQTNAELDEGKIEYTLYGLNSYDRMYTFSVTFVFDYVAN